MGNKPFSILVAVCLALTAGGAGALAQGRSGARAKRAKAYRPKSKKAAAGNGRRVSTSRGLRKQKAKRTGRNVARRRSRRLDNAARSRELARRIQRREAKVWPSIVIGPGPRGSRSASRVDPIQLHHDVLIIDAEPPVPFDAKDRKAYEKSQRTNAAFTDRSRWLPGEQPGRHISFLAGTKQTPTGKVDLLVDAAIEGIEHKPREGFYEIHLVAHGRRMTVRSKTRPRVDRSGRATDLHYPPETRPAVDPALGQPY